jgi:hypothetical protein
VKTLPLDKEKFPYELLPIILFSDYDPKIIEKKWQLKPIEITIIKEFRSHPKNPKRIKYLSLVKQAVSAK